MYYLVVHVANRKISISLPEELLDSVNELSKRLNLTRSELIAKILGEKLGVWKKKRAPKYPTVLWKLSEAGYLRLRSPRFPGRMIRERWIVEEETP
jgi:hypothetical protein